MKASIVIPTKNPGYKFREVLNRVLNQSTDFDYEVLIIDSGSTDGSMEYIKGIKDSKLKIYCIAPSDFGHGKTRNLGVSMTCGTYAILITHDAMPFDCNWLSNLVKLADSDPEIAGVFGRHIAYPDSDPFTANELEIHFRGFEPYIKVFLDDPDRYKVDQGYRQMLHFFSDNNALIRRSVWKDIPYPDVDFAEDQIWAQKIIEAGYKKAYSRDAVVIHSHSYGLFERLQRSFDESHAFHRFFGYVLVPGIKKLFISWLAMTLRDFKFSFKNKIYLSHKKSFILMPFDNFMRLLGYYFGSRVDNFPGKIKLFLSRDKKLMRALNSKGR